jgi:hypothetical protein
MLQQNADYARAVNSKFAVAERHRMAHYALSGEAGADDDADQRCDV